MPPSTPAAAPSSGLGRWPTTRAVRELGSTSCTAPVGWPFARGRRRRRCCEPSDCERRIANRDGKRGDRAVDCARRSSRRPRRSMRRSVVAADQVHRPADRHRARVGARARERATRNRRTASRDLDRSGRCRAYRRRSRADAPAELRTRRVVGRLKQASRAARARPFRVSRTSIPEVDEPPESRPPRTTRPSRPGPRHHHLAAERRAELPREAGPPRRRVAAPAESPCVLPVRTRARRPVLVVRRRAVNQGLAADTRNRHHEPRDKASSTRAIRYPGRRPARHLDDKVAADAPPVEEHVNGHRPEPDDETRLVEAEHGAARRTGDEHDTGAEQHERREHEDRRDDEAHDRRRRPTARVVRATTVVAREAVSRAPELDRPGRAAQPDEHVHRQQRIDQGIVRPRSRAAEAARRRGETSAERCRAHLAHGKCNTDP